MEIANRLEKNLRKHSQVAQKHGIQAYRLYDRDIPEYPFIVDIYGGYVVLYDRREEIDFAEEKVHHIDNIKNAIQQLLSPKEIIIKRRTPQRQESQKREQYQKLRSSNERLVIKEPPAQFWVNLYDYLDTGLFLDHRLLRQKVLKMSRSGSRFLNLFSYTGTVSVFAALGGAKTTVSVDLSNTYSAWAQDNFRLNRLDVKDHSFIVSDVREWMKNSYRDPRYFKMFDLIYIDPPTFSNSKSFSEPFEVEKDHPQLLKDAKSFLKDSGTILFSNNKRGFKLSPEVEKDFSVQDISDETLPFDFHDKKIRKVYELRSK